MPSNATVRSGGCGHSSVCTSEHSRPAATCYSSPDACSTGSRGRRLKRDLSLTQQDSSAEAGRYWPATFRKINRLHKRCRVPHQRHESLLQKSHSRAHPAPKLRAARARASLPKNALAGTACYFWSYLRLPVLPDLLALRRRSVARTRCAAWHLASTRSAPQMHATAPGRARPRTPTAQAVLLARHTYILCPKKRPALRPRCCASTTALCVPFPNYSAK